MFFDDNMPAQDGGADDTVAPVDDTMDDLDMGEKEEEKV